MKIVKCLRFSTTATYSLTTLTILHPPFSFSSLYSRYLLQRDTCCFAQQTILIRNNIIPYPIYPSRQPTSKQPHPVLLVYQDDYFDSLALNVNNFKNGTVQHTRYTLKTCNNQNNRFIITWILHQIFIISNKMNLLAG